MAKRFTDTELWDKEWFMELSPKLKCLVKFVRDKCDLAGVWHPNWILANAYIKESVTEKELLGIDNGNQFKKMPNGKINCTDFVQFQYGTLSEKSPVHRKVIQILQNHKIPYQYPINRVKEEEEDKEQVIENKKDKEAEKEELFFPFFSEEFKTHWNILHQQKKWKKKSFSALQASLRKLSNYPEHIAIKIIHDCIAGEWQGFVTDKYDKKNNYGKQTPADLAREAIALSDRDRETRNTTHS